MAKVKVSGCDSLVGGVLLLLAESMAKGQRQHHSLVARVLLLLAESMAKGQIQRE